jgi:hypothetical protein
MTCFDTPGTNARWFRSIDRKNPANIGNLGLSVTVRHPTVDCLADASNLNAGGAGGTSDFIDSLHGPAGPTLDRPAGQRTVSTHGPISLKAGRFRVQAPANLRPFSQCDRRRKREPGKCRCSPRPTGLLRPQSSAAPLGHCHANDGTHQEVAINRIEDGEKHDRTPVFMGTTYRRSVAGRLRCL